MRLTVFLILISSFLNLSAQDKFKKTKADFSSRYAEYSPTVYKNGFVYCSDKKDDVFFTYVDEKNKHMTNLFFIEKENEEWGNPKRLFGELKTRFHEGPSDFNSDETMIAITLNNNYGRGKENKTDKKHPLGIYFANYQGKHWSDYKAFPFNGDTTNTAHPLLYNDTTLIFVSDKPGGFGKSDLYVSYLSKNNWTEPENLGPNINSEGSEKFPTTDIEGGLYFSSDKKGSQKLDIYYSYITKENTWSKAANYIGINTEEDDFGLIYDQNMETGILTSSKKGDNIYIFETKYPKFKDCNPMEPNDYCFTFTEEGALNVDTLPLLYEWDFGDGTKKRGITARHCFLKHGDYTVELNVIDTITGEVFFNEASYEFYIEEIDYPYIESLDTVLLNTSVNLSGESSHVVSFDIRNYYWEIEEETYKSSSLDYVFSDTGSFTVQLSVTGPLDEGGNYEHKCTYKSVFVTTDEIIANEHSANDESIFTDNTDISTTTYSKAPPSKMSNVTYGVEVIKSQERMDVNDPYFNKLSAEHTVREIINDSITEYTYVIEEASVVEVIKSKQKLNTDHPTFDKVSDEQTIREVINDSITEYTYVIEGKPSIVEVIKSKQKLNTDHAIFDNVSEEQAIREVINKSNTEYTYVIGEKASLAEVHPIYNDAKEKGYNQAVVTAFENPEEQVKVSTKEVIHSVKLKTNELDKYKIDLVLFDHDSYYLKPKMISKLQPLIELMMANGNVGINIETHTDNVGSEEYNLQLSKRRGKSVKKFVLKNNVDDDRIKMQYFGETVPRADNKTVYGRKMNRRVEIKLYNYEK